MERMVLRFNACVLNHASCISLQSAHRTSNVAVYFDDFLDAAGFEECAGYAFFDAEDYSFRGGNLQQPLGSLRGREGGGTNAYCC